MNKTEKVLDEMLKENTGKGRRWGGKYHWQRNQDKDFEKEPRASLTFEFGYMEYTRSVYHFLKDRLTYNKKMDDKFHKFVERTDPDEMECWNTNIYEFLEALEEEGKEIRGLYGEGEPLRHNSYNTNSNLSQTIFFFYFEMEGISFVILRIHNGQDVRSGYTVPRLFKAEEGIFFSGDGRIGCNKCDAIWTTDNDCSWYRECNYDSSARLESLLENGKISIKEGGKAVCPACKEGILEAK